MPAQNATTVCHGLLFLIQQPILSQTKWLLGKVLTSWEVPQGHASPIPDVWKVWFPASNCSRTFRKLNCWRSVPFKETRRLRGCIAHQRNWSAHHDKSKITLVRLINACGNTCCSRRRPSSLKIVFVLRMIYQNYPVRVRGQQSNYRSIFCWLAFHNLLDLFPPPNVSKEKSRSIGSPFVSIGTTGCLQHLSNIWTPCLLDIFPITFCTSQKIIFKSSVPYVRNATQKNKCCWLNTLSSWESWLQFLPAKVSLTSMKTFHYAVHQKLAEVIIIVHRAHSGARASCAPPFRLCLFHFASVFQTRPLMNHATKPKKAHDTS